MDSQTRAVDEQSRENSRGVIYLLTGPTHAVRLVVSLWSLRQHYVGPVTVFTTRSASHDVGRLCAQDDRLHIDHRLFDEIESPKNRSLLTKVAVLQATPYETTVFLDADTLIVGSIDDLFELREEALFGLTQFCNWTTQKRVIRKRIERWRDVRREGFNVPELIDSALLPAPAINVGVFAFRRDYISLNAWFDLTQAGAHTFICDEIAMQLLLSTLPHQLFDARFNRSPIHCPSHADTRIWHFHGNKHVNRKTSRDLWLPAYKAVLSENLGDIVSWTPGTDKRLARLLKT